MTTEAERRQAMDAWLEEHYPTRGLKPSICIREDGHSGPCNGFPRPICTRLYLRRRER